MQLIYGVVTRGEYILSEHPTWGSTLQHPKAYNRSCVSTYSAAHSRL